MAQAARLGDAVTGTTAGEHSERDGCCGSARGSVAVGSGSVFINGKPAARRGDALAPHSGSGQISAGSEDVNIGG